jgi:hypothetical protein
MDVILDTNIYQTNFSLNNNQWDALDAYLQKTNSRLVIPHIVSEELKINFKRLLKKQTKAFFEAAKMLSFCSITDEHNEMLNGVLTSKLNVEEVYENASEQYIEYIKGRFHNVVVLDPVDISLSILVEKALKKQKPFRDSGEGFKDAVIWESLLKYIEGWEGSLAFITDNSRDFGRDKLEENLLGDIDKKDVDVLYFHNLRDFISVSSKRIEGISLTLEDINVFELTAKLESYFKSENSNIEDLLRSKSTDTFSFTAAEGVEGVELHSIGEYYVNDISDDFKYVTANVIGFARIVVVTQSYREFFDRATGDLDYEYEHDLDFLDVELEMVIDLEYSGENYQELDVVDVIF